VWWEILSAIFTGAASVIGSIHAIRLIAKHEQQACDARLDAFREGLDHEHKD